MARTKGSKNHSKNISAAEESADVRLQQVLHQIEKLQAEIDASAGDVAKTEENLKKKKAEQKQALKMMELLKAEKEKLEAAVVEEKHAADAKQVAEAFLKSGKTVEEALALLG